MKSSLRSSVYATPSSCGSATSSFADGGRRRRRRRAVPCTRRRFPSKRLPRLPVSTSRHHHREEGTNFIPASKLAVPTRPLFASGGNVTPSELLDRAVARSRTTSVRTMSRFRDSCRTRRLIFIDKYIVICKYIFTGISSSGSTRI